MSEPPPASVVIATRDRTGLLVATIGSLLASDHVPDEIVIVDQSRTTSGAVKALVEESPQTLTLVRVHRPGLARARNAGVSHARNDLLVFVDDDVLVPGRWLGALTEAVGPVSERRVATGRVLNGSPERRGGFAAFTAKEIVPAEYRGRIDRDVLAGGNMALWRAALDEVGPWDERLGLGSKYPGADQHDYGFRLLDAGYRILFVPEAAVTHRAWRGWWTYPLVRWRNGRGMGGFYMKYRKTDDQHIRRRLKKDVGRRMRRLPRAIVREPRLAIGDVCYLAGLAVGCLRWLLLQR